MEALHQRLAPATMFPMTCAAAEDDQVHREVTSHERVEIAGMTIMLDAAGIIGSREPW